MKRAIPVIICLLLVSVSLASAAVRRVPSQYAAIQMAISDCNDGDVVIVEPGIYFETINFIGKDIVVTSLDPNDPEIVAETIIDADADGTVVTFENGESPAAVLTGFTITGGYGTLDNVISPEVRIFWGAGIYCYQASPTITRNVIAGNHGPAQIGDVIEDIEVSYGGGIACIEGSPVITCNIIRDNRAYVGGGIIVYYGDATITSNLICNNAAYLGGGVVMVEGSLTNNTIVGNDANVLGTLASGMGGNVYAAFGPTVKACQISNNIVCNAGSGGGLFWEGVYDEWSVRFNNVWNNAPANYIMTDPETFEPVYDGPADKTGLLGNISDDPLFVSPETHDYHLQTDSPCISAGDPAFVPEAGETDIDGDPRIYAVIVDIGADEFIGYVKPVAYAGPGQHVLEPQLITLDGSGSFFYDPCGLTLFTWTQTEGLPVALSDPNTMQPTFTPDSLGQYRFELVVSDGSNASRPDEVVVLVGNQPPVADAGADRVIQVPDIVTLDGTDSYDPDLIDELTYTWTQLQGPQVVLNDADAATAFFDCNEEGLYVFDLVVSDGFVDSTPAVVHVTTVSVTINQQDIDVSSGVEGNFHNPDVSRTKVVYSAGWSDDYSWDIFCRDLMTGQVDSFVGGGIDARPRINGDIVVWYGGPYPGSFAGSPRNTSIFVANIAAGVQKTLRQHSRTESYSRPVVSGNKVVWLQHADIDLEQSDNWYNSPYDICGADITDLDDPKYFTIAYNAGFKDPYPVTEYDIDFDDVIDISGDTVVWEGDGDIYGADISNLADIRIFTICDDPARQYDPAISGNRVVWTDERNDSADIYAADISDPENIRELAVVKEIGRQLQPAIDGCVLVYVDGSDFGGWIKAVCLTRQFGILEIELDDLPYGVGPAIDGDTIVWQTSIYGLAQGISLEFGYSVSDGPVENVTAGKEYDYIQHAVNVAAGGDEIVVSPGIYQYFENIDFRGKTLTVRSTDPDDASVVAATIINGRSKDAAVIFSSGEDANCLLAGFTITGADKGIYCRGASPTITRCTIVGNTGGGIKLWNESNLTITNCTITANGGDGIEMWAERSGRFIKYNYATVRDCVIAGNRQHGILGGIPTVTNCTIVGNRQRGISSMGTTVSNSIIYSNGHGYDLVQIEAYSSTVTYSNVQGGWSGIGNIDADPCFVGPGYWADTNDPNVQAEQGDPNAIWVGSDYRLLPDSPCIDAGDPNYVLQPTETDLDGNSRLTGQAIDMGAFESQIMIELSEDAFEFEAVVGFADPANQLLIVRNGGVGTLNWQINSDCDWLKVGLNTGSSAGQGNAVMLEVDSTGLAVGNYYCAMAISAPLAANSPQVVPVKLVVHKSCFPDKPEYAKQYADFLAYLAAGSDPSCWCAPPRGTGYQCDGDADGDTQTPMEYRVFTNDLLCVIENWKKKITDPTIDPCCDFDHKAESYWKYRVYGNDLAIVVAGWKKKSSDLPGDCPRPNGQ